MNGMITAPENPSTSSTLSVRNAKLIVAKKMKIRKMSSLGRLLSSSSWLTMSSMSFCVLMDAFVLLNRSLKDGLSSVPFWLKLATDGFNGPSGPPALYFIDEFSWLGSSTFNITNHFTKLNSSKSSQFEMLYRGRNSVITTAKQMLSECMKGLQSL